MKRLLIVILVLLFVSMTTWLLVPTRVNHSDSSAGSDSAEKQESRRSGDTIQGEDRHNDLQVLDYSPLPKSDAAAPDYARLGFINPELGVFRMHHLGESPKLAIARIRFWHAFDDQQEPAKLDQFLIRPWSILAHEPLRRMDNEINGKSFNFPYPVSVVEIPITANPGGLKNWSSLIAGRAYRVEGFVGNFGSGNAEPGDAHFASALLAIPENIEPGKLLLKDIYMGRDWIPEDKPPREEMELIASETDEMLMLYYDPVDQRTRSGSIRGGSLTWNSASSAGELVVFRDGLKHIRYHVINPGKKVVLPKDADESYTPEDLSTFLVEIPVDRAIMDAPSLWFLKSATDHLPTFICGPADGIVEVQAMKGKYVVAVAEHRTMLPRVLGTVELRGGPETVNRIELSQEPNAEK